MKRGQKGFGAIEALLFLILVSILGFTGYYVYHSRNNTNSTYNKTADAGTSPLTASSSSSTPQLYYFKELGVYIKLTGPPLKNNLDYEVSNGSVQYLDLSTPATQAALNKCAPGATGGIFLTISKVPGQFDSSKNPDVGNLKQFKDFWISGAVPNGIACSDTASQADIDNWNSTSLAAKQAVIDAFKTATQ